MRRLHDLSIKAKLSAGFGLSLTVIFAIGIVALVQVWGINALATRIADVWVPEMETLDTIKRAMNEQWLMALRRPNPTASGQIAADAERMQAAGAEVDDGIRRYVTLDNDSEERELFAQFRMKWTAYLQSVDPPGARLASGETASPPPFGVVSNADFGAAARIIDTLLIRSRAEGRSAAQKVRSIYGLSIGLIAAVLLFAAAIVSGAIHWISSDVSKPILKVSDAMRRLSSGDNSANVLDGADRKDEIGILVNAVASYRDSLDRVRQLADKSDHDRGLLDAALTNMSQGLCAFDANQRLLIFNRHFAELFKIPPDKIAVNMPMREVMQLAQVADRNPQAAMAAQAKLLAKPEIGTVVTTLSDGATVSIVHRAMPEGGYVATFDDITERMRAEDRIRHLALFDGLTDLPNRASFYEQMGAVLRHLRRAESVGVLSLDLDHFKNVNDTLGYPLGDLMLKAVAARIRSCVRDEDVVGRLGADEFAVIQVPAAEPPNFPALAARLIEIVGAPYDLDGHQVMVGISVGIAIAPADGSEPDILMKNADLALYRAKADGGGTYRFFELQMDVRMQARRALELDLRQAVTKNEFLLHYQPILDVKTGRTASCEALIRWDHQARGIVPPLEFIPVAEATGLIVPIGEWVLHQACAEASHWPRDVTVAVNLSPAQFKGRNLIESVKSALASSGLPADSLELEITEQVLLQESDGAFALLHQLRDLGIKIAMDDFGTGYSSLGYLRSFPFDKIKIDQSFIQDLSTKRDSVAIIRAVVGLSSSLGITTIAEGVETNEQFDSLKREGCTQVQGFLFSQPIPAKQLRIFLAEFGKVPAVA